MNIPARKLTEEAVSLIRRSDLPDSHFAELFNVGMSAIRNARIGATFKTNPVPAPPLGRKRGRRPQKVQHVV